MRLVLGIVLLWSAAVAAETADTNCYRYGNRVSCQTVTTPQHEQPRPNVVDSFLKGREARLRHDQMQLQNELLQQQLDANKRAEFERDEDRRTESALRAKERWEQIRRQSDSKEDEVVVLQDYWRQQMGACARIEKRYPERGANGDCVDNLLVSDPDFARAHAAARRNHWELSDAPTEPGAESRRNDAEAPIESTTCTPASVRLGSCGSAREP